MTVFSKKAFAFANPDSTSDKDREFKLREQDFAYNIPEELQEDAYFKLCVADGDIVVMDSPKQIDEVLKNGTAGKRNSSPDEKKAEDLGIIDGGESK